MIRIYLEILWFSEEAERADNLYDSKAKQENLEMDFALRIWVLYFPFRYLGQTLGNYLA